MMNIARNIIRSITYNKYRHYKSLKNITHGLQSSHRNFVSSTKLYAKMFTEYENNYAYNFMQQQGYAININLDIEAMLIGKDDFENLIQKDWSKEDPINIFKALPKFAVYCSKSGLCISNKIFDNYIDNLTDKLRLASDNDLKCIFYDLAKFPETESIRTRNYIEVWAALDDECLNRSKTWSYDEMLSFTSLFFMLNVTKYSEFSNKCLQKLATKAKNLNPGQLVQTMFFVSVFRKAPFDMHNLELQVDKLFSEFCIDDLAIISMGFFKSKTPIRDMKLVVKIINKVIENSKDIHEVTLAAILKTVRYSMKIKDGTVYQMLEALQHEVPRLSIMCNVHLALLGTATLTLHKNCLTKICDIVNNSISKTRLKDLERLTLTFGIFNFKPDSKECFFQKTMDELRKPERQEESQRHGKSLACCVAYLGLLGFYPKDLMNIILSQEFLRQTYGKYCFNYGREILTIHNCSKIFLKETNMNRLSDKEALILAKKLTDYVPSEDYKKQYNVTDKMILDIMKVLIENRGKDYVVADHILTHHQRGDVIICNNNDGQPEPVIKKFDVKQFGTLKKPPDNNKWIVFVIAGRNTIIHDTDTPTGYFNTKLRELRHLGFYPTLVPWTIYSKLGSYEMKTEYLNNLIQQAVKNK